jgi:NAD(P)-dependent dehydrogenase (short-subunit alcohol dehydrogenase family)
MNFNFRDKAVVVTGAGSGIGKATAALFAKFGARIAVLDCDERAGVKSMTSIQENGGRAEFIKTDVGSEELCFKAASLLFGKPGFASVDVLVNNAGVEYTDCGGMVDMPKDKLERILRTNLMGALNCVRAFIPKMERGSIVNVSSVQALATELPGTSYQMSKAGLLGLTHALAMELAPRIRVNAVLPGAVATTGMGKITERQEIDRLRRRIPLARRGRPDEVAGTILFLASDFASYITGTTLIVDGGLLASLAINLDREVQRQSGDPD